MKCNGKDCMATDAKEVLAPPWIGTLFLCEACYGTLCNDGKPDPIGDAIVANAKNKARIEAERKAANKSTLRSYRIKS